MVKFLIFFLSIVVAAESQSSQEEIIKSYEEKLNSQLDKEGGQIDVDPKLAGYLANAQIGISALETMVETASTQIAGSNFCPSRAFYFITGFNFLALTTRISQLIYSSIKKSQAYTKINDKLEDLGENISQNHYLENIKTLENLDYNDARLDLLSDLLDSTSSLISVIVAGQELGEAKPCALK